MIIVIMGVSGCGKSTIGKALALALDCAFVEGDDYHPASNVAKMSAGQPLTDADRAPWLAAIGRDIAAWRRQGCSAVLTCSALKRSYRDRLGEDGGDALVFVYLQGSKALIDQRMRERKGHFMPATLLDSQFAALEEPGPDEPALTVPIDQPVADAVSAIQRWLTNRRS